MPRLFKILAAMSLTLLSACATDGVNDTLKAIGLGTETRAAAPARVRAAEPDADTANAARAAQLPLRSGRWLTVFSCQGHVYRLETDLTVDGDRLRARVAGTPRPSGLPPVGGARQLPPFGGDYTGQYDPASAELVLTPDSSQLPSFVAMLSADGELAAAQLEGAQWSICSSAVLMAPGRQDFIDGRLSESPSASGALFKRLGQLNPFAQRRPKQCDPDALAWVRHYLEQLPAGVRNAQAARPYVAPMYAEERFRAAFGTPLAELSVEQGQIMAAQASNAALCGLSPLLQQKTRYGFQFLVAPLQNHMYYPRDQVALDLAAGEIYRQWLLATRERLVGWRDAPSDEIADRIRRISSLEPKIAFAQLMTRATPIEGMSNTLTETRTRLAARAAENQFAAALAAAKPDMTSLVPLVALANSNRANPDGARSRAAQRIDALLPQAMQLELDRAHGVGDYVRLSNWRQAYPGVINLASRTTVARLETSMNEGLAQMAKGITKDYRAAYQREVTGQPRGADALAAGVAFERRIASEAQALAGDAGMRAFAADRAARRAEDLAAARSQFVTMARDLPHLSAIESFETRFLLDADRSGEAAREILGTLAARRRQLAPFGGPAARYFNALYGGDTERLRALDTEFAEPYRREMVPVMQQFGVIVDGLAALAGSRVNTGAAFKYAIENVSLIVPVWAIFLVEYEGRLRDCMDAHPVTFQHTVTTRTIYRNGYGTYLYELPPVERHYEVQVNRRFAGIYDAVGLTNPRSTVGQLADQMFGGEGRLKVSEIVDGTRSLMNEMNRQGCNSPLMARMVDHMEAYFADYKRRQSGTADALFGNSRRGR